jgi:hypothetical protein
MMQNVAGLNAAGHIAVGGKRENAYPMSEYLRALLRVLEPPMVRILHRYVDMECIIFILYIFL